MLEARLGALEGRVARERRTGLSVVVSSDSLDRVMSALILATGAASAGQPARLFFTFWAVAALRRPDPPPRSRGLADRLLGWLLPRGTQGLQLSRLRLGGVGTRLLRRRMLERGVPSCEELLEMAAEAGVEISVCEMTMDLLGVSLEDLVEYPGLQLCGVSTFLETADRSSTTLFV